MIKDKVTGLLYHLA